MRIEQINVNNYRGKQFHFEPANINIFLAKNGTGKTSLCDAIRFGLSGASPTDHVKNTSVELTFPSKITTERVITNSGNAWRVNGKNATKQELNQEIMKATGVSPEQILIASSGDTLLNLEPDKLLKHLLQYIPEMLDFNTVIGYFSHATSDVIDQCSLMFPPMPEKFGLNELDKAYQCCYDDRTAQKSILNKQKTLLSSMHAVKPNRSPDEIEKELSNLLLLEKEQGDILKRKEVYETAKKKRLMQDEAIKKLQEKLSAMNPQKVEDGAIETVEQKKKNTEGLRLKASKDAATVKGTVDLLKRTLRGLETQICPISEKLICTTDKTGIRTEMEHQIQENEAMLNRLEQAIQEYDKEIEKCISAKNALEVKKREFDIYQQYTNQLKVYQENLVTVPEEPKLIMTAQEISEKKRNLAAEKENYETYVRQEKLKKDMTITFNMIKVYDYIIPALKDKGEVKNGIINYYISMFKDTCNARAAEYAPGYEINFLSQDGIQVFMKTPYSQSAYPLNALSDGERILAAFILTDMCNQLSGARIMFIDRVEAMDKEALVRLRKLIEKPEFQQAYDHIFICGVDHSDVVEAFLNMNAKYL